MLRVIRNVPLEEQNLVPARDQLPAQAAPESGMPIAPGGADRQAENRDLHPLFRGFVLATGRCRFGTIRCDDAALSLRDEGLQQTVRLVIGELVGR